jgi:hypothetical protein
MNDPDRELAALRPGLAVWWRENYQSFVRQGMPP